MRIAPRPAMAPHAACAWLCWLAIIDVAFAIDLLMISPSAHLMQAVGDGWLPAPPIYRFTAAVA